MPFIKEPKGVDLNLAPSLLLEKEREKLSEIIARFKITGVIPKFEGKTTPKAGKKTLGKRSYPKEKQNPTKIE